MSFESVMPPYNASDPTATFLNSSCLDFLLIELVPMASRVTRELDITPGDGSGALGDVVTSMTHSQSAAGAGPALSSANGAVRAGSARKMDEDEERDAVFYRLETMGYRVGQGLVER